MTQNPLTWTREELLQAHEAMAERIKALETELEKRQSWLPMGACDEAMREAEGIARQETATAIAREVHEHIIPMPLGEMFTYDALRDICRGHGAEI